jgi:hypothetical protein
MMVPYRTAVAAASAQGTQARRGVKLVAPVVDTDPHQYSLKTTFGQHDAGHAFPGLQILTLSQS